MNGMVIQKSRRGGKPWMWAVVCRDCEYRARDLSSRAEAEAKMEEHEHEHKPGPNPKSEPKGRGKGRKGGEPRQMVDEQAPQHHDESEPQQSVGDGGAPTDDTAPDDSDAE